MATVLETISHMYLTQYIHLTAYTIFVSLFPIFGYLIWFNQSVEGFIKRSGVRAPYDKFYVATLDDYIIGCVGIKAGNSLSEATTDTEVCSIWRLTVDEKYRQYGLGKKLMAICEDYAIENKYKEIKLLAGNIASIKFYDRLGYTRESVAWSKGRHESINFHKLMKKSQ